MLSIPLGYTQREMTQEQAGVEWTMPLVLGYDEVTAQEWFGDLLDEDLVTLTALPGVRYQLPLDETWTLKPFGNLVSYEQEDSWFLPSLTVVADWNMPINRRTVLHTDIGYTFFADQKHDFEGAQATVGIKYFFK